MIKRKFAGKNIALYASILAMFLVLAGCSGFQFKTNLGGNVTAQNGTQMTCTTGTCTALVCRIDSRGSYYGLSDAYSTTSLPVGGNNQLLGAWCQFVSMDNAELMQLRRDQNKFLMSVMLGYGQGISDATSLTDPFGRYFQDSFGCPESDHLGPLSIPQCTDRFGSKKYLDIPSQTLADCQAACGGSGRGFGRFRLNQCGQQCQAAYTAETVSESYSNNKNVVTYSKYYEPMLCKSGDSSLPECCSNVCSPELLPDSYNEYFCKDSDGKAIDCGCGMKFNYQVSDAPSAAAKGVTSIMWSGGSHPSGQAGVDAVCRDILGDDYAGGGTPTNTWFGYCGSTLGYWSAADGFNTYSCFREDVFLYSQLSCPSKNSYGARPANCSRAVAPSDFKGAGIMESCTTANCTGAGEICEAFKGGCETQRGADGRYYPMIYHYQKDMCVNNITGESIPCPCTVTYDPNTQGRSISCQQSTANNAPFVPYTPPVGVNIDITASQTFAKNFLAKVPGCTSGNCVIEERKAQVPSGGGYTITDVWVPKISEFGGCGALTKPQLAATEVVYTGGDSTFCCEVCKKTWWGKFTDGVKGIVHAVTGLVACIGIDVTGNGCIFNPKTPDLPTYNYGGGGGTVIFSEKTIPTATKPFIKIGAALAGAELEKIANKIQAAEDSQTEDNSTEFGVFSSKKCHNEYVPWVPGVGGSTPSCGECPNRIVWDKALPLLRNEIIPVILYRDATNPTPASAASIATVAHEAQANGAVSSDYLPGGPYIFVTDFDYSGLPTATGASYGTIQAKSVKYYDTNGAVNQKSNCPTCMVALGVHGESSAQANYVKGVLGSSTGTGLCDAKSVDMIAQTWVWSEYSGTASTLGWENASGDSFAKAFPNIPTSYDFSNCNYTNIVDYKIAYSRYLLWAYAKPSLIVYFQFDGSKRFSSDSKPTGCWADPAVQNQTILYTYSKMRDLSDAGITGIVQMDSTEVETTKKGPQPSPLFDSSPTNYPKGNNPGLAYDLGCTAYYNGSRDTYYLIRYASGAVTGPNPDHLAHVEQGDIVGDFPVIEEFYYNTSNFAEYSGIPQYGYDPVSQTLTNYSKDENGVVSSPTYNELLGDPALTAQQELEQTCPCGACTDLEAQYGFCGTSSAETCLMQDKSYTQAHGGVVTCSLTADQQAEKAKGASFRCDSNFAFGTCLRSDAYPLCSDKYNAANPYKTAHPDSGSSSITPGQQDFPTDCFLVDDNNERYIYNKFDTSSPSVEIAIFPTRGSDDYSCKAPVGLTCPPIDYSNTAIGRAQVPSMKD